MQMQPVSLLTQVTVNIVASLLICVAFPCSEIQSVIRVDLCQGKHHVCIWLFAVG